MQEKLENIVVILVNLINPHFFSLKKTFLKSVDESTITVQVFCRKITCTKKFLLSQNDLDIED